MKLANALTIGIAIIAFPVISILAGQQGQGRGQGGGSGQGGAPPVNLPQTPTAVSLPTV